MSNYINGLKNGTRYRESGLDLRHIAVVAIDTNLFDKCHQRNSLLMASDISFCQDSLHLFLHLADKCK